MSLDSKTYHDNAQINVFVIISLVILVFYNLRFRPDTFLNYVIFIVRMVITKKKECNSKRISLEVPMKFNILNIYMVPTIIMTNISEGNSA